MHSVFNEINAKYTEKIVDEIEAKKELNKQGIDNSDKEMDCLVCTLNKENACADCCRDWDNEDDD